MSLVYIVVPTPEVLSGVFSIDLYLKAFYCTYVGHMKSMCIRNEHGLW